MIMESVDTEEGKDKVLFLLGVVMGYDIVFLLFTSLRTL